MKRILALAALLLLSTISFANAQGVSLCYTTTGNNCIKAVHSFKSIPINIAADATTQLITLNVGQSIYISNWNAISSVAGNMRFVYGTGTTCGTGTTSLTGTMVFGASTFVSVGDGMGSVLTIPKGNALCVISAGNLNAQGSIAYSQF